MWALGTFYNHEITSSLMCSWFECMLHLNWSEVFIFSVWKQNLIGSHSHPRSSRLTGPSKRNSGVTNLSTSQSTYSNHRVILLSTWVFEHLDIFLPSLACCLGSRTFKCQLGGIYSAPSNSSHCRKSAYFLSVCVPNRSGAPLHCLVWASTSASRWHWLYYSRFGLPLDQTVTEPRQMTIVTNRWEHGLVRHSERELGLHLVPK
jgi:hypothetical protein